MAWKVRVGTAGEVDCSDRATVPSPCDCARISGHSPAVLGHLEWIQDDSNDFLFFDSEIQSQMCSPLGHARTHTDLLKDGSYLIKWRLVLGRTPVCRKHHNIIRL